MTIFNVLVREGAGGPEASDSAVLVPDHFSRAAFIFGPFWLMRHRVWRWLLLYVALLAGAALGLHALGVSEIALTPIELLLALFLGLEGQALRRAALERRGFKLVDIVSAPKSEEGERLFFARWLGEQAQPARPAFVAAPSSARQTDVLGLFPESGGPR